MKKIIILIFLSFTFAFPQSPAEIYNHGLAAYNSGLYAEAVKIFRDFRDQNDENEIYASATFYLAESYYNLHENTAAIPYFEYLVNNYKWTAYREKSLYRMGLIFFEDTRYDHSRKYFTKLLTYYPEGENTGAALYWIGESYIRQDKKEEALKFLTEAVEKRKENKFIDKTIYSLASVYESNGDYENAVKYYDELLSYHRNSPLASQAQIRIGICYFKMKDYESSILELNNPSLSNLSDNEYSESLYLLANSYFKVGSYSEAEKIYREINERYPSSPVIREVQYGLAWSLFQQKQYNDAFKIFNFLSDGQDSIAEKSFLWKAESQRYSGKENDAFELYKEFLDKYPDSNLRGEVQYQMGVIYFDDDKPEISEKYLSPALHSEDTGVRAKAFTLKGEIELNKKSYAAAKDNFEKVIQLTNEKDVFAQRAWLGLGIAYFYLGNYDQGIRYLTKISTEASSFESDKVNFYLAENLYASGKYQQAAVKYNLVSNKDRSLFGKALFGRAYANFNLGKYDQAVSLFNDFIKNYYSDKNLQDAKLRLADSYYGAKNYVAASNIYRDLFSSGQLQLTNPYLYFQYAQVLYRAGRTDEAITKFYEVREKFPESEYAPRAYYMVGWIYFQRNEYEKAIAQYQNTLTLYPGGQVAPVVYYSIGDAYYNMGKYDSAIVNYEKIINLFAGSPNIFDALNGIQYAYVAENQPEKAIEKIQQYLSDNPSADYADQLSFKRGEIYYSSRSYEKAKNSYKDFINNYKNSKLVPEAYFWIGKSAQNLGQNEEAVYNYNRVIDEYPKSEIASSAVLELTAVYNQMKNYDASVNLLNKILPGISNESPRKSEFLYLKGMSLLQKGDNAGAADVFDEVSMYYKGSLFADQAKYERGLLDLKSKSYSTAETGFRELAESRSDDLGAKAQFYLGETLFQQKKINDAITAFVRVRTVFSGFDEWLTRSILRLGDCYIQLKEPDKAADMYRTVLSRNRGDQYGDEAQKKLRAIR